MVLNLLTDSDPFLRIPTNEIEFPLNGALLKLATDMEETRKAYKAAGLAANQVGLGFRMFVMGDDKVNFICINPEIISVSEKIEARREGCLSFNGLVLAVKRPVEIECTYYDITGKKVTAHFDGLFARCFQHELDHLNGKVFTDHVSKLTLSMAQKKRQKRIYGSLS